MDLSKLVTIDYETEKIAPRPVYPPEPVGLAIRGIDPSTRRYLSWGHPSGNNCRKEDAQEQLYKIFADPAAQVLCHNAGFEMSVSVERMGMPMLPWHRIHDTTFMLFLDDPHARSLGLKQSAERVLGWAPTERDAVNEWIWENRAAIEAETGEKVKKSELGAWISKAPAGLVGPYAIGDVDRTLALALRLLPMLRSSGMWQAYDRERRLLPILLENERRGLRVDLELLQAELPMYESALLQAERQMREYLGTPDLNFDNDNQLAEVFQRCGVVKPDRWVLTERSKQLSVSKDNLPPDAFVDPLFASAFGYRNRLITCLKMFMRKWEAQASTNNGHIHTQWNQIRNSRGGTRSGRPSMTDPNLLNVSKSFADRSDGYVHPAALQLPELPLVRKYITGDEGEDFLHRDFSGQEVRIFAHYESGDLAAAYRENPALDPHDWVKAAILEAVGKELERTRVKNVTFARLYGGGKDAVYAQARCASLTEAKEIMAFHDRALPGRKILSEEIQRLSKRGEPIVTWGGRLYYVEPPSMVNGRRQTWDYKLINYLIQGSAADVTKEAICRWYEQGGASNEARFLLTVYDEINISSSRRRAQENMRFLREIMDGMELDVPMRSDGKAGERWGALTKVDW